MKIWRKFQEGIPQGLRAKKHTLYINKNDYRRFNSRFSRLARLLSSLIIFFVLGAWCLKWAVLAFSYSFCFLASSFRSIRSAFRMARLALEAQEEPSNKRSDKQQIATFLDMDS